MGLSLEYRFISCSVECSWSATRIRTQAGSRGTGEARDRLRQADKNSPSRRRARNDLKMWTRDAAHKDQHHKNCRCRFKAIPMRTSPLTKAMRSRVALLRLITFAKVPPM